MDYHLENLRTGEAHGLNPNRTLIGTADHAAVRTADGTPYLAAVIVRYPAGWTVHGLSEHPGVMLNRNPLRVGVQAALRPGDLLEVGDELFRFVTPRGASIPPAEPAPPHACFVYVTGPDGMEECRAVDHDLLFGRLAVCHVRFHDTRLSRLAALLAAHDGEWYIHALSKGPVGRNRRPVTGFSRVEDGDELLIGPVVVRVEIRPPDADEEAPAEEHEPVEEHETDEAVTDELGNTVESALPEEPEVRVNTAHLQAAGLNLDNWLKTHTPTTPPGGGGLSGWLGAQKQRLSRFWYDTPEATAARGLRAAGKLDEAFAILDRAIRAHPDSPELLRELYRLYDAAGLHDLCYRPLRVLEKLAFDRGSPDTWVLETLARVCEKLGRHRPGMIDRAVGYWSKLEKVTGVSYARERNAVLGLRGLREGGFTPATDDGT